MMDIDVQVAPLRRQVVMGLVIAAAFMLAFCRVDGFKGEAFQALAHCFTFTLFGYGLGTGNRLAWWLFGALTVVESLCFLHDHFPL